MEPDPARSPRRRGSGPGDTRARLMAAASELLAQGGADAVTLRAVGERVGVSRTAPYRHFRDKEDLLSAVAAQGFERLHRDIAAAMAQGDGGAPPSLTEALRRGCTAYIDAGLASPEHYRLMFGEHLTRFGDDDLHAAASAAMGLFVDALERGQQSGAVRRGDTRDLAILTWSALHGLVTLALSGHLARKGLDIDEVAARLAAQLVNGLEP
ncbi:TetR/AcrR family transcriptional regulator [Spinactinospora alkalitolerans]